MQFVFNGTDKEKNTMKFNTHDRTPKKQNSKFVKCLLSVCVVLLFGIFVLASFVVLYYEQDLLAGICIIMIPVFLALILLILFSDLSKAYVEIIDNSIHVVDYYFGRKKEKYFTFSDITSAEVVSSYSFKIKGYRMKSVQYIILKKDKEYLFKIIYLPETEQLFNQYLNNK